MGSSIITQTSSNNRNYLLVKTSQVVTLLHFDEILFLEGDKNCTTFNTLNYLEKAGHNLGYFEPQLPDNFMRVHRSYIINLDYFKSYNFRRFICLKGCPDVNIPLGCTYEATFQNWFYKL